MPAPNGHDVTAAERIARGCGGAAPYGDGWTCRCPVPSHNDHTASLTLNHGPDGKLLWHCHKDCGQLEVRDALMAKGLLEPRRTAPPQRSRLVATYTFRAADGRPAFLKRRYEPGRDGEKKSFSLHAPDGTKGIKGIDRVLYNLPEVLTAEEVYVCEGEKDADNLAKLGLVTTTNYEGASTDAQKPKWRPEYSRVLAKVPKLVFLPHNDGSGRAHMQHAAKECRRHGAKSIRVLELPDLAEKGDVSDWLGKGNGLPELAALLAATPEWQPRARADDARADDARAREEWTTKLKTKGDSFAKNDLNIRVALLNAPDLQGRLRLNQLTEQVECRAMPWSEGDAWTPWLDTDDVMLAEWLQERDVEVKAGQCGPCVASVARFNPHHPVRAYLAGLEWDGVPRLSLWLTTYLGAYDAPPEYVHAVGRAWLISLVARAMRPGCQVDHLLILEGPQGARKSSALRTLVPDPAWFTDNISALGTKDSAQDLRGKWLIELSDLSAMKRTEVERIKAAISHPVDHYRPSYGRYSRDFPRQCVFAGTTNEHAYLFDSTGNRRFWCLKIGRIQLEGLKRDRGQLWAEARHAFEAGEKWHLEPAVELLATAEQAKRREEEPFTGPVLDWVAQTTAAEFHIVDIMRGIGIADASKHTKAEAMRIAAILRDAGCASRHTERGKAWRRLTPAERCQEVSAEVVSPFVNDSNDIQKTDTSTPVLPQTLRARADDAPVHASSARAHDRVWPKKVSEVSAGAKSLKPNGEVLTDTSLTPALTPAWAADWPTWDGRCGADSGEIEPWLKLAGGARDRATVTLPAACREHPEALKRLLSHITLQGWKVSWT